MIVRASSAEWRVTCSVCGAQHSLSRSVSFPLVVRMIKAVGWKVWNRHGMWQHACPKHSGERAVDVRYLERLQA